MQIDYPGLNGMAETVVKKIVKKGDIENVGCHSATLYSSSSYLS